MGRVRDISLSQAMATLVEEFVTSTSGAAAPASTAFAPLRALLMALSLLHQLVLILGLAWR